MKKILFGTANMDAILSEYLNFSANKPLVRFCSQCGSDLIEAEIDGRIRLACISDTCNYVFWDPPTPVVAAVVEFEGKVILARNKKWPEGMFGLITGFLEKRETPESCILREVKEELSLEGEIVSFIGHYSFFEMNQVILAFHVRSRGQLHVGEELAEIKLVTPKELRPWSFGAGLAVQDWLQRQ